jgi:hypothetical protein
VFAWELDLLDYARGYQCYRAQMFQTKGKKNLFCVQCRRPALAWQGHWNIQ